MISVKEAKAILSKNTPEPVPYSIPVDKSGGLILAEDLYSPINVPAFDNSAMDGYGIFYDDYQKGKSIKVNHTVQAGMTDLPKIRSGEAVRIFTGAPIPDGIDTIIMQELTSREEDILNFSVEITKGDHVRKAASQTGKGQQVAQKGMLLNPGLIGFLAGLGISEVLVYKAPEVAILTSGKELVPPGRPLKFGQVYESSSYALTAALAEINVISTKLPIVDDKRELMMQAIEKALVDTDILLITGGISVGDYDFVQSILEQSGVEQLFYRIRQKPGKPLFAGKRGNKLIFGLPGNPASTLTCFYQYVRPTVLKMMGKENLATPVQMLPIQSSMEKKEGLTQFMKGLVQDGEVWILPDQESYKMNSFAQSNCLVELDEEKSFLQKGELVKVHLI